MVSRRSKRFGVTGIVAGQVVSTICSADGLVMSLERPLDTCCLGACSLSIVNQVLVRLWARRGRKSDRMWSVSREGFLVGDGSSRGRGNVFRGVCCVLSKMILYGIVLEYWRWCLVAVVSDNRRLRPDDGN